jgi:hypothetical protein
VEVEVTRVALLAVLMCLVAPATAPGYMNGVPSPPHVTVVYAPCPVTGDGSCAMGEVVYLYDHEPYTRQHELGHLVDWQRLDDVERAILQPPLGAPAEVPWVNGTGVACAGRLCPNERFADAYATCRLGMWPQVHRTRGGLVVGAWESYYGYAPETNYAQRRNCGLIRQFLSSDR